MHTLISLLQIFFLIKEFRKLFCFDPFKQLVLPDGAVIVLVIFQWYSTKKLYCCGLDVQILSPLLILTLKFTMITFRRPSANYLNSNLWSHLLLSFSTCPSSTSDSKPCKWSLFSSPMQIVVDIQILFYSPLSYPLCTTLRLDLVAYKLILLQTKISLKF